jgi:hypothetical protein
MFPTAADPKNHADGSQQPDVPDRVSFWVPTSFEYTTFR